MSKKMRSKFLLVFTLVSMGLLAATEQARPASAQSGGSYDLTWNTIDGGGGTSAGGAYSLSGTIGQPDAGTLSGGSYALNGGFWVDWLGNKLNLPLIVR
jgi:hypothetical protein